MSEDNTPEVRVGDVEASVSAPVAFDDVSPRITEDAIKEDAFADDSSGGVSSTDKVKTFPIRETVWNLPFVEGELRFNWFTSFFGLAFLWGIAIFCMGDPEAAKQELDKWFNTTVNLFTWFYIVGNPVMTFFVIWLAYRFGSIKLGKKDAEPEFSDASYFAMLFSAGVGVGLFFYGKHRCE